MPGSDEMHHTGTMKTLEDWAGHYAPPRKTARGIGGSGSVSIEVRFGGGLRPGEKMQVVKLPELSARLDELLLPPGWRKPAWSTKPNRTGTKPSVTRKGRKA